MFGPLGWPPVSGTVKDSDGSGAGSNERSVTGTEVTRANAGVRAELCKTMEPAWSPGDSGVWTVSVTAREPPGGSVTERADRVPNGSQVAVLAPNSAGTDVAVELVPSTAVHSPAAGSDTWTF